MEYLRLTIMVLNLRVTSSDQISWHLQPPERFHCVIFVAGDGRAQCHAQILSPDDNVIFSSGDSFPEPAEAGSVWCTPSSLKENHLFSSKIFVQVFVPEEVKVSSVTSAKTRTVNPWAHVGWDSENQQICKELCNHTAGLVLILVKSLHRVHCMAGFSSKSKAHVWRKYVKLNQYMRPEQVKLIRFAKTWATHDPPAFQLAKFSRAATMQSSWPTSQRKLITYIRCRLGM